MRQLPRSIERISNLDMHHLTCGISSLLHSVNLILFTLLLVHLILHISPHHGHHLRSHHLSLPQLFTPDFKNGHSHVFVLISLYYIFIFCFCFGYVC